MFACRIATPKTKKHEMYHELDQMANLHKWRNLRILTQSIPMHPVDQSVNNQRPPGGTPGIPATHRTTPTTFHQTEGKRKKTAYHVPAFCNHEYHQLGAGVSACSLFTTSCGPRLCFFSLHTFSTPSYLDGRCDLGVVVRLTCSH